MTDDDITPGWLHWYQGPIREQWGASVNHGAYVTSLSFVGMFIGSIVVGALALAMFGSAIRKARLAEQTASQATPTVDAASPR
jgi:hypothetical protein